MIFRHFFHGIYGINDIVIVNNFKVKVISYIKSNRVLNNFADQLYIIYIRYN